jgi:hypothetical protein
MVDPSDAAIFGDTDGRTLNERAQRNDRGTDVIARADIRS